MNSFCSQSGEDVALDSEHQQVPGIKLNAAVDPTSTHLHADNYFSLHNPLSDRLHS